MKKRYFGFLLVLIIFISGCTKGEMPESVLQEMCEKESWPPECSVIQDLQGREMCEKCRELMEEEKFKPIEEEKVEEPVEKGPTQIQDRSISGVIAEDQVWSGTIHVTGDINVNPGVTLTILPGTSIKVALTDDQHKGRNEPMTDPYFPKDPPFYEKEKVTIYVGGTLKAVGTPDNRIVFTSESENPTTYDWRGIGIAHGRLEYATVEYALGDVQIQENSDVVIANNIIRNSLGCCICIGHSNQVSPHILKNDVYNCGHECIDYAGGSAIIKGNHFHSENPEIQPDPLRGENGIILYTNTYPTVEDNVFEKLTNAIVFLDNSKYPEQQGKKVLIKNNRIENNNAAFNIGKNYPFEVVVRENNNLINNKEAELYNK